MTHAHRREFIEAALSLIADDKQKGILDLLNTRAQHVRQVLSKCASEHEAGLCCVKQLAKVTPIPCLCRGV